MTLKTENTTWDIGMGPHGPVPLPTARNFENQRRSFSEMSAAWSKANCASAAGLVFAIISVIGGLLAITNSVSKNKPCHDWCVAYAVTSALCGVIACCLCCIGTCCKNY